MTKAASIFKGITAGAVALTAVSVVATKVIDGAKERKARAQGSSELQDAYAPKQIRKQGFYERYVKRPQDFACALLAIVGLSPVIGVTAVLVRTKLGSPVVFKQKRPGKDGRLFEIYKFRTMTDERDSDGNLLPDGRRMTELGRKLRESSCDELLELGNILKGDMAVIGPRPQLVRDMVFMTPEQLKRHSVRPGLSGLAQVNGRNGIGWNERLEYDIEYVDDVTFIGDWKLVGQTILKVFRKEDIASEGMETSEDLGDELLRTGVIGLDAYEKGNKKAARITAGLSS